MESKKNLLSIENLKPAITKALQKLDSELVSEKRKIDATALKIKKEKLSSSLKLMDKPAKEISSLTAKTQFLEIKIIQKIQTLDKQIALLLAKLVSENDDLKKVSYIVQRVSNFDQSAQRIDKSRSNLLNHEKRLLKDITKMFLKNRTKLRSYGMTRFAGLRKVLGEKLGSLTKSKNDLAKHQLILFKDKNILFGLQKEKERNVLLITQQLKALQRTKKKLLNQKKSLGVQILRLQKERKLLELKKKQLLKKLGEMSSVK